MRVWRLGLAVPLLAAICGAVAYRVVERPAAAAAGLSSYAPQGALLAIESPDFAGLLKAWTGSKEEKGWLGSDNYAGFSRSRLFSRLSEAQGQFAATAGLAVDARFVEQVAGKRSLLAWYDIGQLQFLYVTEMAAGEAEKTPLLALRSRFEERKVGDAVFFVRTEGDPARTVAFAVRGDYLLLGTDENLMAGALQLMQQPAERTLRTEPWYAGTVAAAARTPGDLRMTLNMTKIVRSPYFRSYWVQQNITEMKSYSAALSDLYRSAGSFREERVLLAADGSAHAADEDLAPVLEYVPARAGVYRASARPLTDAVLEELEDRLLSPAPGDYRDARVAPVASLETAAMGDAASLEERIDEPSVVAQPRSAEIAPLRAVIDGAGPQAMLVFSSTDTPGGERAAGSSGAVFVGIHTGIVVTSPGVWSEEQLKQALLAAVAPRLSVQGSGPAWTRRGDAQQPWSELTGMQGLVLAVEGKTWVLASDESTLLRMMDAAHSETRNALMAITVAGFDHGSERAGLLRLSRVLDHRAGAPAASVRPGAADASAANPTDGAVPSGAAEPGGSSPLFFSGNVAGLSDTFADLQSASFSETEAAGVRRQTVVYEWRR